VLGSAAGAIDVTVSGGAGSAAALGIAAGSAGVARSQAAKRSSAPTR
jgi:hypothetical protein